MGSFVLFSTKFNSNIYSIFIFSTEFNSKVDSIFCFPTKFNSKMYSNFWNWLYQIRQNIHSIIKHGYRTWLGDSFQLALRLTSLFYTTAFDLFDRGGLPFGFFGQTSCDMNWCNLVVIDFWSNLSNSIGRQQTSIQVTWWINPICHFVGTICIYTRRWCNWWQDLNIGLSECWVLGWTVYVLGEADAVIFKCIWLKSRG